jgi:hypothetical protein
MKFFSKIQISRNHFKSHERVGLIISNPMQLVWVQTDIGSDKYQFCSKWQTGKKGMLTIPVRTVCTDDDVADYTLTWKIVR